MDNRFSSSRKGDGLFRSVFHTAGHRELQSRILEYLAALFHVGTLQANHHRDIESDGLRGVHHSTSNDIAPHDTAKNVDEDRLHILVGQENLERASHLVRIGSATDVEEIGGTA